MKKHLLSVVKFLVFLGLGVLLSWLAVRGLKQEDKEEILRSISEANYVWIALSMTVGVFAHFTRALRWKMLLQPLGLNPKTSNTFYAVMIGYLGNLALPRLGEVLRCGILKRYENIPLTQSFGTVIVERVIDLIMLLLMFVLTALLQYQRMHSFLEENIFNPIKLKLHSVVENKLMLVLLIGAAVAAIVLFFLFRKRIVQNKLVQKFIGLLNSFLQGIQTGARVKNPLLFIFYTLFIWAMYLVTVFLCVFAFAETKTMTLSDCVVLMAMGSLGVIATPGGVGAYQWIVLQIMLLWGYSTAMGVAFGWVVWLAQTTVVVFMGLLSFALLAIGNKEPAPDP